MLELVLVNLALLVGLCALPKRSGGSRWSGRRNAKVALRSTTSDRCSLGAIAVDRGRRIANTLWPVVEPQLFAGLPRALLAVPAIAATLLVFGGPGTAGEVPAAGADASACSAHDPSGGRMTTAPEHERWTTPPLAGYLTET